MIATSHSTALVSIAEASRMMGLSPSSTRLLCDDGTITTARTAGGHRRCLVSSIREWCGLDIAKPEDSLQRRTACYVRVSSTQQNGKTHGLNADGESSLDRQRQRVMKEAAEREGVSQDDLLVFSDVASSFADTRKGLNSLLDAIIQDGISRLYILQVDRLSRLGCVLGIVNHFAEAHGVEIVYLDDDTDRAEANDDWQELMVMIANTIQHANARMAGKKSAKVVTKHMATETVAAAKKYRAEGLGLDQIAERLNREGHTLTRQDGTEHAITRHALRKWAFCVPKGKLELATQKDCQFANWWAENIEPCAGNRVECSRVYETYHKYRKHRGYKHAGLDSILGRQLKGVQRERRNARWYFLGWKMKGDDTPAARIDVVDSFAEFVSRFIVKGDSQVETRAIWPAYVEFCHANNLKIESRKHCGLYLKSIATGVKLTGSKTFVFYGLKFVG